VRSEWPNSRFRPKLRVRKATLFQNKFWIDNTNQADPTMPATPPRQYEIVYRLKTGNSGQQRTIIQASDPATARRIFEQQNPGCVFQACRETTTVR